jgi:hypothetical protein
MLLSLVYLVLRRLLHALAPSDRSDMEREAELLVLRHQLKVLSRGVRRPVFRRRDRMLLAAASRILPRERWKAFVMTCGVKKLDRGRDLQWVARIPRPFSLVERRL